MGRAYDVKWWIEKWERLTAGPKASLGWRVALYSSNSGTICRFASDHCTPCHPPVLKSGGPKFALNKGLSNSDNLCMLCPAITGG